MSLGKAMIHARKQKSIAKAAAYSGDYTAVQPIHMLQMPVLVLNASYEPINICGARRALASVATHTESAPASINVLAAARAVAPVVRMSSTSRMCFPATAAGSKTVKAPRTFNRRCLGVRPAWLWVARSRINVLEASVSRHSGWDLPRNVSACVASDRAWLKLRCAYFDRCSGTGTTSISAGASPASWPMASASIRPS